MCCAIVYDQLWQFFDAQTVNLVQGQHLFSLGGIPKSENTNNNKRLYVAVMSAARNKF